MAAPGFWRTIAWSSRLLFTGAAQLAIQVCGFVAGLVVIRMLPPDQYAYYTLTLATLGMLTVLSDGGVSTALMAFGGPCWQDPKALGEVYQEANRYRRLMSIVALVVSLPFLVYFLLDHRMTVAGVALLCLVVIPLFIGTVTCQLREVILKLHQQLAVIQTIQVSGAALRALTLLAGLSFFPLAWMAVLAAGLSQLAINIPLGRRVAPLLSPSGSVSPAVKEGYRKYVQRSLPGAVYFGFSGQVNVLIISLIGTTQAIAQVGVAGRLGAICSVITAVIGILVIPRFARAKLSPRQQLQTLYSLVILILLLGFVATGLLWQWPECLPWIVGKHYSELEQVVVWSIWSSVLGIAGGTVFHLAAVRGHIMRPLITIGTAILSVLLSLLIVGASTPVQVFQMNALSAVGILSVALLYSTYKFAAL